MARPPWSRRQTEGAIREFFVLREGVPDGLLGSLTAFVTPSFYVEEEFSGIVSPKWEAIEKFARLTDRQLPANSIDAAMQFRADRTLLLDAVDFVLGQYRSESYQAKTVIAELRSHFDEARSAYVVGIDGNGRFELQDRQPEELTDLVADAISGRDRASEHLQRAWSKAFGRRPDATGACLEAVAAIEVAAKPLVSPNNSKATLGTIIGAMKAKPSKWRTDSEATDDVEKVIAMMEMVWTGHFRHGDDTKPIDVSNEGAVMIVQLAALLVHWFRSGRISAQ